MDSLAFDFDANAQTEPQTSGHVIPRATVRDMVARRQKAIDLFGRAYVALTAAAGALTEAKLAHAQIDQRAREDSYMNLTREEERHFLKSLDLPASKEFTETARKVIDRRMWSVIVELTDLEKLMDKKAKDQLRQSLMDNVPEATEENIFATLQTFAGDADHIFKRGIANCFMALDRRFRSHDGWKIGSRVILTNAFNEYGGWSYNGNQRDTLHDIDRVFNVLDGRDNPNMIGGIVGIVDRTRHQRPRATEHDSDYFKVRCFQNGNAHVWFKRKDLVEKVNLLLGEYYGAPIPDHETPEDDGGLSTPKTSLAKNYGFFPTPDAAAQSMFEHVPLYRQDEGKPPYTVLEPSAGTGNLAKLAQATGAIVDCVEIQPALAEALGARGKYRHVWPADFLTMQPNPDRLYDRVVMNPPFDRERDIDHVMHALKFLKPDGCLVAIMSAGTEFRETRKSIAFRALMEKMGAWWRDLPAGSFASVGTQTNTIILRVWNDSRTQSRW